MKPERAQRLERLVDADPHWTGGVEGRDRAVLIFECPIHGDHYLSVPLRNPLDGGPPVPWFPSGATWQLVGAPDFATLTLEPSIHVLGGENDCEWHGFIRNGRFEHCGDSR